MKETKAKSAYSSRSKDRIQERIQFSKNDIRMFSQINKVTKIGRKITISHLF